MLTMRKATRRQFLRVGALSLGGLTLTGLSHLRADERSSGKRVINVFLRGGPSHIDMYDLKPTAPAEYRGEFRPVHTTVPGLDICELLPRQAAIAHRFTVIRNMYFGTFGSADDHQGPEILTGMRGARPGERSPRPLFGSVVSRLRGQAAGAMPPYVMLEGYDSATAFNTGPLYLGAAHRPYVAAGPDMDNLRLPASFTPQRLANRRTALQAFDDLRRDLDTQGDMAGMDAHAARALDIIASPRTRDAFDIGRESARVRDAYGPTALLLQARRLAEAGVGVVDLTLIGPSIGATGHWDTHTDNFTWLRATLPGYDRAISALVNDLYDRGLDQDVAVVVWGEMGRTPRTNGNGRDHWPQAGFAVVIGGGLRMGQVIGATDARAEQIVGRRYTPQNMLATLYCVLGIDPRTTFRDHLGRPQPLVDDPEPIAELL